MIAFVRIFATGFLHTLKLFTVTLAVILRSVRELVELPVLHDSSFSSLVCDPLGSDLLRMTVGFPTWISQMEHAHEHVSSNGYWLKNVHHMYHMCRVSPLSGYVRVSSNHQLLRSVNHICHICMVSPLSGYVRVSSNHQLLRSAYHIYHICMVSPLYGCVYVSSNHYLLRNVHRKYHICKISPQCEYGCVSLSDP